MELTWTYKVKFSCGVVYRDPRYDVESNLKIYGRLARSQNGTGFNYILETIIRSLNRRQNVIKAIHQVVKGFDKKQIDQSLFAGQVPTSERIAQSLFEQLLVGLPTDSELVRVCLYEGDSFYVEYPFSSSDT